MSCSWCSGWWWRGGAVAGVIKRSTFLHRAHTGGRAAVRRFAGAASANKILKLEVKSVQGAAWRQRVHAFQQPRLTVTLCVRGLRVRDVGVSGESSRGAARQRRESRGGRAGAGRQALPGRALLRLQPERAVQTVQRQPVRVLQQVQKGVGTQGQIGNRLHLVWPGPETLAGLFAGDAVACLTFQRQT